MFRAGFFETLLVPGRYNSLTTWCGVSPSSFANYIYFHLCFFLCFQWSDKRCLFILQAPACHLSFSLSLCWFVLSWSWGGPLPETSNSIWRVNCGQHGYRQWENEELYHVFGECLYTNDAQEAFDKNNIFTHSFSDCWLQACVSLVVLPEHFSQVKVWTLTGLFHHLDSVLFF